MKRAPKTWGWRGALLALALASAMPARADDVFVAGLEDLPLMPRLVEHSDERLAFEGAGGRIVESTASGPVARAEIVDFYARTLPELGWRAEREGVWAREGERLRIEFPAPRGARAPAGLTVVRFRLAPD